MPVTINGPQTWIVHMVSLTGNGDPNWAKSGIMVRASTTQFAATTFMAETSGQGTTFQVPFPQINSNSGPGTNLTPQWLELTTDGNGNFSGYYSNSTSATPPTTWTQQGTTQNVAGLGSGSTVDIGLFSCAHNDAVGVADTGVFDYNNFFTASSPINLPNNVTVSGASTLDLGTAPTAQFGDLTLNANSTLTVTGTGPGYQMAVGQTNLGGNATINVSNNGSLGTLTLGYINGGGNLTKTGPGLLQLTGNNSAIGNLNINGGVAQLSISLPTGTININQGGGLLADGALLGCCELADKRSDLDDFLGRDRPCLRQ